MVLVLIRADDRRLSANLFKLLVRALGEHQSACPAGNEKTPFPRGAFFPEPEYSQARKKSTKINFLGPETALWGGGLPREGVVAEKCVLSLESLSSLGFEERKSGMSQEFCRDVPDP